MSRRSAMLAAYLPRPISYWSYVRDDLQGPIVVWLLRMSPLCGGSYWALRYASFSGASRAR